MLIRNRFNLGLNAINIAPEYGTFETQIILNNIDKNQLNKLYNLCYSSKKWVKWVPKDFQPEKNKEQLIKICCHYIFNDKEFEKIKNTIPDIDEIIGGMLRKKLKNLIYG